MRLHNLREHVFLLLWVGGVSFCCFDEEPVLDLTDLNVLHIWLVALSLCVVIYEPTLRARSGQLVYKDFVTLAAIFTFWLNLENYFRLVLVVCSLHNLFPYEVDLFEQTEIYLLYGAWLTDELLPAMLILGGLLGLGFYCNASLGLKRGVLTAGLVLSVCGGHAIIGTLLGWDLLTAGLSSIVEWERSEVFYLQPKTGWTYDRAFRVSDQFEWHRERVHPYSLRFEDLYLFLLQILLLWDVLCSLICWLYLLGACFDGRLLTLSYTQLGLGLLWLEHLCYAFAALFITLGVSSLRLLTRVPGELAFWWL